MNHLKSLLPVCTWLRCQLLALRRRLARDPSFRRSKGRPLEDALGPLEIAEDLPKGCGWFDSSYELGQGLVVCEHEATAAAQALAEAPLADWLAFQLSGFRPPVAAQA